MGDLTNNNPLTQKIITVVKGYSSLAKPIVEKQCEMLGVPVDKISSKDLPALAEHIGAAVGMFTNPAKGAAAKEAIRNLAV